MTTNNETNTKLPDSLTTSEVLKILDNVVIGTEETDTLQSIYSSNGLDIAVLTQRLYDRTPIAILYVLDGGERTRIPGVYQEGATQTNMFIARNLVKAWYQHITARACRL